MNLLRARIAFEREIASRWPLALVAYGLVGGTLVAGERWRDGWALFAAALLPMLLAAAAVRAGSGSDSWFRGMGGSAFSDTVGRTAGHAALVGLPFAVNTIVVADVLSYIVVNARVYALVALLLYASLVAGRALVPSSAALVGPLCVVLSVGAGTALGWVLVGAWAPEDAVLVRLAIVAFPLAALAARWDALGTWGAQVGSRKVWARAVVAATIATGFLTVIEAADDGPLSLAWLDDGPWLTTFCGHARDGRTLCEDSRIRRVWLVSDDAVRLLPEREVEDASLGPAGSYALFVEDRDGSRVVFHSPRGAVAVLEDVDNWMGFSPSGRWAVRTREGGVTIVELDGSIVVTHARDAAWLGEDLLLRTGFSFELLRAGGERTPLADVVPAFVDPSLDFDDRMLSPRGDGRVQVLTSIRSGNQLGFVADHVADACARGPGCPGLLEPMQVPRFERLAPPEAEPAPPRARLAPVVEWLRG